MRRSLRMTVSGALVGASVMSVVAAGGEAGASKSKPVRVTCTSLRGGSDGQTLSVCDDPSDTAGGGVIQTSENIEGAVTNTVTWNTGLTTIEPVTEGQVLTGMQDRCKPPPGYRKDSEVKFKGTVTGGTAADLVGGLAKSTVCVFSQDNNSNNILVENKPGTVVTF